MRSYPWYTFISLDQPRILTNRGGQMCGQREPWHFSSPNTRCKDVSQLMQHNLSKQKSPRLQSLGAEDVVPPYVEHPTSGPPLFWHSARWPEIPCEHQLLQLAPSGALKKEFFHRRVAGFVKQLMVFLYVLLWDFTNKKEDGSPVDRVF